jgi:imidazolonepropionase-like amidohydrolase
MRVFRASLLLVSMFVTAAPAVAQSYSAAESMSAPAPAVPLPQPPAAPEELVIRGGMLIDGVSDRPVRNTGILMRGGTLMEVNADLSGRDLSKARVIELRDDEYIMPGLIDMHAHFEVDLFGTRRVDEVDVNPIVYLANGITSLFDGGESDSEAVLATRRRIDTAQQIGPRIFNAGPRIGTDRQGASPVTVEQMNQLVDSLVARGVKGFKAKGISPPMLKALVARAHSHGLTVTGHLDSGFQNTTNAKDAILLGIDRVEHVLGGDAFPADKEIYASLPGFDPNSPAGKDIIQLFLKHRVFFDPTHSANGYRTEEERSKLTYDERRIYSPYIQELKRLNPPRPANERAAAIREARKRSTKALFDAGGLLTIGTDSPGRGDYHAGFVFHSEMATFVEAGVPNAAVLKMATMNGARALNLSSKLGSVEVGKFADLVVVNGNPLADIRNTRNVKLVVKAGVPYDPAQLLKAVEGKLGPNGPEEVERWGGRRLTP